MGESQMQNPTSDKNLNIQKSIMDLRDEEQTPRSLKCVVLS